jgi:sugar lactone lactonase YvrE
VRHRQAKFLQLVVAANVAVGRRFQHLLFVSLIALAVICPGIAFGDPPVAGDSPSSTAANSLTPQLIQEALSGPQAMSPRSLTDPEAAEELPRNELGRGEALKVAESVFGDVLEGAGIWDALPEARLLDSHTAVMSSPAAPIPVAESAAGEPELGPVLVESSVPMLSEAGGGGAEPVDLSLEHSEGAALQPVNPLVPAEVPAELGDGIALANNSVHLSFEGAASERSPSVVEEDLAFYPNSQEDTDLLVAPTPGGVETMTQLRSAEAPGEEVVRVNLPAGAILTENDQGGAEAALNGRTLLNVPPPTAVDAAGDPVPMTLSVSGDRIDLKISPSADVLYPILADPLWLAETYSWTWGSSAFAGWTPSQSAPGYRVLEYAYPSENIRALDLTSGFSGGGTPNTGAQWYFGVPRFYSDNAKYGEFPTSWLERVHLEGVQYLIQPGPQGSDPVMVAGILDPYQNQWISVGSHTGAEGEVIGWSGNYEFPNYGNHHGKLFSFGLITRETEAQAKYRRAMAATAIVEIHDDDTPQVQSVDGPSGWWDTGQPTVSYAAKDSGLGIYSLRVTPPGQAATTYPVGCTGGGASPCPREVKSEESAAVKVPINVASAPEGADTFTFAAADPLYSGGGESVPHVAASSFRLNVDHTAPTLSLTGTLPSWQEYGSEKPQYTLAYSAADGIEEAPTLQGTTALTILNHPADIALDAATNRWIADASNNRIVKMSPAGEVLATYSTLGSSDSLSHPTGIDIDASGNVWVCDSGHNRVVEFNPKGEWMRKIGSLGSGNGQFSSPQAIAATAGGNVWVADTGNNRIEEFSSAGAFIGAFGRKGSATGQFSEPSGIDTGPDNSVWIADTGNSRIEKFKESGEFVAAYGSLGTGKGKFSRPGGIDVDPRGSVWVIDQGNGRVEQFSERGEYLSKFGFAGTGEGQFTFSTQAGITTSSAGVIWVTDPGDNRFERWSSPQGTRSGVRRVTIKVDGKTLQESSVTCPQGGCPLVGEWTLHSGEYTAGAHTVEVTAADGVGLATTQKVNITLDPPVPIILSSGTMTEQATLGTTRPRYTFDFFAWAQEGTGSAPGPPTFSNSFGSAGSSNGQFSHPAGIAIDANGNAWVVDRSNNRIEQFNSAGAFVKAVGSTGSGNGQFAFPKGIAIDHNGNFWVVDSGNNRLEEFNPSWEFIKSVGGVGSGNGQFSGPEGIGIDYQGNIWVADTYNHRVQKLNERGEFVKVVAGLGSIEPTSIAAGTFNRVWVTDWANNRVVQLTEGGEVVRSFGTTGTAAGQFKHPDAAAVDATGYLWVIDEGNARIEEFDDSGDYLAQFGSPGTAAGQFSFAYPVGIATDETGSIWISDTSNNRVQHWHQGSRSQVNAEIILDGQKVESGEARCSSETCSTTREWILDSSMVAPGRHTIVAKATDGYGKSATDTRTIEIQRDTEKPLLQVGGELANAPEGWVQQESYGFNAMASDGNGYGITSLLFKIDGAVKLSTTKSCPEGGCSATISGNVNMALYSGGAHEAEVVATDGGGNSLIKRWTINVDPEGHISTAEAAATVEAAEETGSRNLVGEAREETEVGGSGPGLGFESTSSGFVATGSVAPTEVSSAPGGSMTIGIPNPQEVYGCSEGGEAPLEEELGEVETFQEACSPPLNVESAELIPVAITPIKTAVGAATPYLIEENATISANTEPNVDTTIRPLNDGGMVFTAIRDQTAPAEYSYRVTLGEEQELRQIDETHVQAFYNSGQASFLITAEPASDAIGTTVPTTLRLSAGDVVTLTVHHRDGHDSQPFVYPVVAGSGWEGGFRTITVEMDNLSPEEATGANEGEVDQEPGGGTYSDVGFGPVTFSRDLDGTPIKHRPYNFHQCRWSYGPKWVPEGGATSPLPPKERNEVIEHCHGSSDNGYFYVLWAESVWGNYQYKSHDWSWDPDGPNCIKWGSLQPKQIHCHATSNLKSPHLDVLGQYRFPPGHFNGVSPFQATCHQIDGYLPTWRWEEFHGESVLMGTLHLRHSFVGTDEHCNWSDLPSRG